MGRGVFLFLYFFPLLVYDVIHKEFIYFVFYMSAETYREVPSSEEMPMKPNKSKFEAGSFDALIHDVESGVQTKREATKNVLGSVGEVVDLVATVKSLPSLVKEYPEFGPWVLG